MTPEYSALRWLRYEKRCTLVVFERSPLYNGAKPDVFGVLPSRLTVEIEIKRTLSDFKANSEKRCVRNREFYLECWPSYFYFLIPKKLTEKVVPLLPEWSGLMWWEYCTTTVVRKAPRNLQAKRLTIKQMIRMVELQSNMLVAQARAIAGFAQRDSRWEYEVQI